MTSTILVTGGTGTLGRRLVPLLQEAGHHVRVLSRRAASSPTADRRLARVTGDLATGTGLDAAVAGVDVVVHLAGSAKGDALKTSNLVRAMVGGMVGSGLPLLVYISVVGADRVPVDSALDRAVFGYYPTKLECERIVATSGLPWTTLRATQFHDSMFAVLAGMARSPILPAFRGVRFQPVDTGEVAARLATLATAPPSGLVPDLAGPRAYAMADLARSYLRATGKRRLVATLPISGAAARAVKAGGILPMDPPTGRRTWEDFLVARTAVAAGTSDTGGSMSSMV